VVIANPKPNCQRSTALAFGTLQSPALNNQPSTIDARKELSSNELGRTPSHQPDGLTADQQHTVPARPVKAQFAFFAAGAAAFGARQNPVEYLLRRTVFAIATARNNARTHVP